MGWEEKCCGTVEGGSGRRVGVVEENEKVVDWQFGRETEFVGFWLGVDDVEVEVEQVVRL